MSRTNPPKISCGGPLETNLQGSSGASEQGCKGGNVIDSGTTSWSKESLERLRVSRELLARSSVFFYALVPQQQSPK
jgi:hypothetical protein